MGCYEYPPSEFVGSSEGSIFSMYVIVNEFELVSGC